MVRKGPIFSAVVTDSVATFLTYNRTAPSVLKIVLPTFTFFWLWINKRYRAKPLVFNLKAFWAMLFLANNAIRLLRIENSVAIGFLTKMIIGSTFHKWFSYLTVFPFCLYIFRQILKQFACLSSHRGSTILKKTNRYA
jgi:hypothetical protein